MEQIKTFFRTIDEQEDVELLEKKINKWLVKNGNDIEIIQRSVVSDDDCLIIFIFYKQSKMKL